MVVIRSAVSGEQLGCCDVEAVAELKAWVADQLEVPAPRPNHNPLSFVHHLHSLYRIRYIQYN